MDEEQRESLMTYIRDLFAAEDHVLHTIRTTTIRSELPTIHIRPEEGRILQFLLGLIDARRVLEIGALAGYSGTWMARALPSDGLLITLEQDPDRAEITRGHFARAGLADRTEVRVGRAPDALPALSVEGPFDAMFIDANKEAYPQYLEWAIENIRVGGLIIGHNAFMGGRIVDPGQQDDRWVQGMRRFNQRLAEDPQLDSMIIPIGDGLAAARRIR